MTFKNSYFYAPDFTMENPYQRLFFLFLVRSKLV